MIIMVKRGLSNTKFLLNKFIDLDDLDLYQICSFRRVYYIASISNTYS